MLNISNIENKNETTVCVNNLISSNILNIEFNNYRVYNQCSNLLNTDINNINKNNTNNINNTKNTNNINNSNNINSKNSKVLYDTNQSISYCNISNYNIEYFKNSKYKFDKIYGHIKK